MNSNPYSKPLPSPVAGTTRTFGTSTPSSATSPARPPLDREALEVLTAALEGGYSEEFEVTDFTRVGPDRLISRATLVTENPEPSPDHPEAVLEFYVDAEAIRRGIDRLLQWADAEDPGRRSYLGQQVSIGLEEGWGYVDAIGADAVLQFSTFGGVIYG